MLPVRSHLRTYVRDTYLGKSMSLNPRYAPIDCAVGSSQWGISSLATYAHRSFDIATTTPYSQAFHQDTFIPNILARFGLVDIFNPEQVFLGHGSFNLGERIAHKLIEPGKLLGVGPQFVEIPSEFIAAGFTYRPIPLTYSDSEGYKFPMDRLCEEIDTGTYTALYLDNPNNPLGYHVNNEEIAKIVALAERKGCIVLLDEAYGDFLPDTCSSATLCSSFSNLIVIRSLSKAFGIEGLRVGYAFMSSALAQYYRQLDVPFEPTIYAAVIGNAVMQDMLFMDSVRNTVIEHKQRIYEAFNKNDIDVLPTHPATSIMSITLRHGGDICEKMTGIGIAIENGSFFAASNPQWDDRFCRFRIPAPNLTDELIARVCTL